MLSYDCKNSHYKDNMVYRISYFHNGNSIFKKKPKNPTAQENSSQTGKWHDDVIKWKYFPRYWPFVRGIHRTGEFPVQRSVTQSFDVFLDLRLNKRLSKQPCGWWFETPSWSFWRQCNGNVIRNHYLYMVCLIRLRKLIGNYNTLVT